MHGAQRLSSLNLQEDEGDGKDPPQKRGGAWHSCQYTFLGTPRTPFYVAFSTKSRCEHWLLLDTIFTDGGRFPFTLTVSSTHSINRELFSLVTTFSLPLLNVTKTDFSQALGERSEGATSVSLVVSCPVIRLKSLSGVMYRCHSEYLCFFLCNDNFDDLEVQTCFVSYPIQELRPSPIDPAPA